MMRYQRMNELSNSFNHSLQGIAAGFGTAQQQASKQAALRGDGTVGGGLGDLAGIQEMQDQTIKDNEHARFMGNAQVFADSLSQALGRKVTVQEAQMYMNNTDLMRDIATTMTGNQSSTNDQKNFNAARAAAADDVRREHPDWTPDKVQAEAANRVPSGILATGAGANAEDQAYYVYAAQQRAAGLPVDDILTWKEQHKQAATETEDAHKIALQLPGLKSQLTSMDQRADTLAANPDIFKGIMASTSKQQAASQIFNWDGKGQDPAILYGNGKALTTEETTAVQNARQLHLANYASNFKDATPGQRLSQQEAKRLGDAADQLGNFSGTVDDYTGRINDVKNRIAHAMGNAHGEARDLNSLPVQYRAKIDPSFLEGPNALKNLPSWAKPTPVNSEADIAALPDGQAYKPGPGFGKYSGKILFKGQEAGYEDY